MAEEFINLSGLFRKRLRKKWMHVRARIKIAGPSDPFGFRILHWADVIPELRMIQSQFHKTGERHGSRAGDFRRDIGNKFSMSGKQSDTSLAGNGVDSRPVTRNAPLTVFIKEKSGLD